MHRQAPGQEHEFNGFSSRLPFILFLCSFYSLFGPCHNPNPYQQKPVSAPTEPEHQARRCVQAGVRRKDAAPLPPPTRRPTSPKKTPKKNGKLRRATCRSQPHLEHFASRFLHFTPKRGNPGARLPHCPHLGKPQTLCTSPGASRRFRDNGARWNNAERVCTSSNEAPEFDGGDPEARGTSGPRSRVPAPGWPHLPSFQLEAHKKRGSALPEERVKVGGGGKSPE